MIVAETFMELVKDPNHWLFEIMLMVLFDGLIGALAWPFIKKAVANHDAKKHAHVHCDDVHPEPTIEELLERVREGQVYVDETMKHLESLMAKRK